LRYRTLWVPAKACTAALSGAGTGVALADAAGNPDANEAAITSITLFIAFSFGIRGLFRKRGSPRLVHSDAQGQPVQAVSPAQP